MKFTTDYADGTPFYIPVDSKYPAFPSIPRRNRLITITEKMDGTNGLIRIVNVGANKDEDVWYVRAGGRNTWLTPTKSDDNYGFARWVDANKETLVNDLGEGDHYGEWWGSGIQSGYGLINGVRYFSLFNSYRWYDKMFVTPNLSCVPLLAGNLDNTDENIRETMGRLVVHGSFAAPGFMNPEGVVIYDHASGGYQKVTLNNDGVPKSKALKEDAHVS